MERAGLAHPLTFKRDPSICHIIFFTDGVEILDERQGYGATHLRRDSF